MDDTAAPTKTPALSIVVPVYNSADCLSGLVEEIERALASTEWAASHEIVFVNDSSADNSWDTIVALADKYPVIRGISLMRNFGQHNATMAGLRHCRGQYIITMDDDLQHPPSAISAIVEKLRAGSDVCYTTYLHRKHSFWKVFGSHINNVAATMLLGKPLSLYLSSFRGMTRAVAAAIAQYDGPYTYLDGLILNATRRIATVEIEHQARFSGVGNYNLVRSVSLWLKMATSFSVLPLRLASVTGMVLGLCAAALSVVIVWRVLMYGIPYPGWASVIVAVLLVGSIQLLCIGLVGEYIGRAYLRLNNQPQYVVREAVGNSPIEVPTLVQSPVKAGVLVRDHL